MPCVLQKIWKDRALVIVIVQDWPNKIWYCQYLLNMVIREIVIPPRSYLLILSSNSNNNNHRTEHSNFKQHWSQGSNAIQASMFQCARFTTGFKSTQDLYQHEVYIRKWLQYYQINNITRPSDTTYGQAMSFLTYLVHKENCNHGMMAVARSVLSAAIVLLKP